MSSASKAVVIIIDSDTDSEEAAPKPSETHLPQASPAPGRQPAQPQATRSRYGPKWGTNLIADDGSPASLAASRYGPSRGASATGEAGNPAGLATVRTSSSATLSRSATPSRPLSARKRGLVGVSGRANRPLLQGLRSPPLLLCVPGLLGRCLLLTGLKSPTRKPPSRGSSAARTPLTRKSLTETPPRLHSGNSSKQAQGLAEWGEKPTEEGGSEGSSEMSREPMAYSVSEGIHTPRWGLYPPCSSALLETCLRILTIYSPYNSCQKNSHQGCSCCQRLYQESYSRIPPRGVTQRCQGTGKYQWGDYRR